MAGHPRKADLPEDSSSARRDGNTADAEITSVQKGRFLIETAPADNIKETQSLLSKKGRFQITDAIDGAVEDTIEGKDAGLRMLFEIMYLQNRQVEMLYDMVKNVAGEDKLFQKEFTHVSSEVYEKLETVRKSWSK